MRYIRGIRLMPRMSHAQRRSCWGELSFKCASATLMYKGLLRAFLGLAVHPILRRECSAHPSELDLSKLIFCDMKCCKISPPATVGLQDARVHAAGDPRRPSLRHL